MAIRIQRIQEVDQNTQNKLNSHKISECTTSGYVSINSIVLSYPQLDTGVSLGLSIQDCLLSPLILMVMIIGIVIESTHRPSDH